MTKAYRILYIEDQVAESMRDDLQRQGYLVELHNTDDFISLFETINKEFDAYLLDFRLTVHKGLLDAPAIASSIRTDGIHHKDTPIVLISNERNLPVLDKDLTSQDLFDFAVSKEKFRADLRKYSNRINSFINAYRCIKESHFKLNLILGLTDTECAELIDSRIVSKLEDDKIRDNVYAYCRFINTAFIRSIGPLIGVDVLAARLGVDPKSTDWEKLLEELNKYKYRGILADSYDRWWMDMILKWWSTISQGVSLRRTSASDRVNILRSHFGFNLKSLNHSSNTNFWTICMITKMPLDPIEGYIIKKKDISEWQEMEYISLVGALENPDYQKFLSQIDRREIRKLGYNGTV